MKRQFARVVKTQTSSEPSEAELREWRIGIGGLKESADAVFTDG